MAGFFFEGDFLDEFDDLLTGGSAANKVAKVIFDGREQARSDLAVRR